MIKFVEKKIKEKNSSYPEYVIGKLFDKSINIRSTTTTGLKYFGIGAALTSYCSLVATVTALPAYGSEWAAKTFNAHVRSAFFEIFLMNQSISEIPTSVMLVGATAGLYALGRRCK